MDGSLLGSLAPAGGILVAAVVVFVDFWKLGRAMDRVSARIDSILKGGKVDGGPKSNK